MSPRSRKMKSISLLIREERLCLAFLRRSGRGGKRGGATRRAILLNSQTELIKRLDISIESFSFYVKIDATKLIDDLLSGESIGSICFLYEELQ